MNSRIEHLKLLFSSEKIDGCVVAKDINIQYLTYFPASESWLLVSPKKSVYITDFRYTQEAKKGLKGVSVYEYSNSLIQALFEQAKALNIRFLGFDEHHFSLYQYNLLKKLCPKGIKLVSANGLVESLREQKDSNEISCIRKALDIHNEALHYIKNSIKPNNTETGILNKLQDFIKRKGVGFSFSPIVASGPNSSYPHAKVTSRKFKKNDIVLLDMGIDYKGYKSDLTRMFFLGKIPNLISQVNAHVRAAQRLAIQRIRSGVAASYVDFEARNYLETKGLAKYFGHSLGHGVGLEIHESPRLSQKNKGVLRENMVITVEPAVYLANQFGIRIEDMVLVKKDGCEVISGHCA